jgi:uncharacterized protein YkwD
MIGSTQWSLRLAIWLVVLTPAIGFAQTDTPRAKEVRKDDERIKALLEAHNKVREDAKLPALTLDPKLNAAALVHAKDMAEHDMMSHEGTDGSTFNQRIDRQGYRFKSAAENVAFGQRTVAQAMKSWMNSPHHKENILGPYAQVGFAVMQDNEGRSYWCADFAMPWPKLDAKTAASAVIDAFNRERDAAGLEPLKPNDKLTEVAIWGAKMMANDGESKSREQIGAGIVRQAKESGYRPMKLAESAASGQASGTEVAKAWLGSANEKKLILGEFTEVGVGLASSENGVPHWCLILGKPLRD